MTAALALVGLVVVVCVAARPRDGRIALACTGAVLLVALVAGNVTRVTGAVVHDVPGIALFIVALVLAAAAISTDAGDEGRIAPGSMARPSLRWTMLTCATTLDGAALMAREDLAGTSTTDRSAANRYALAAWVVNVASLLLLPANPTSLVIDARHPIDPARFATLVAPVAALGIAAALLVARRVPNVVDARTPSPRPGRTRWFAPAATVALLGSGVGAMLLHGSVLATVAVTAGIVWLVRCLSTRSVVTASMPTATLLHLVTFVALGTMASERIPDVPVGGLTALAVAATLAATINNLPAAILLAHGGLITSAGVAPAMIGLAVGALVTRHGSVATLLVLDSPGGHTLTGRRYLRTLTLPALVLLGVAAGWIAVAG